MRAPPPPHPLQLEQELKVIKERLRDAREDRQHSQSEQKKAECLASLQRLFPVRRALRGFCFDEPYTERVERRASRDG